MTSPRIFSVTASFDFVYIDIVEYRRILVDEYDLKHTNAYCCVNSLGKKRTSLRHLADKQREKLRETGTAMINQSTRQPLL